MNYERYQSADEARAAISYELVLVESVLSLPRRTTIRWIDENTDMFFQTFIGMESPPGKGHFVANRRILLVQGHGERCNTDVASAPPRQHGRLKLPDGREAVWALGIPQEKWRASEPAWVAWSSKSGAHFMRVEGSGVGLDAVKAAAGEVALLET